MERLFGTDFSAVRVHEGPEAPAIGAAAYTQGSDIHFAPGQYDPSSPRGQELLGHELGHVVQQAEGRVPGTTQAKGAAIHDDAGLEREADEMGARAARGEPVRTGAAAPIGPVAAGTVQRKLSQDKENPNLYYDDSLMQNVVICDRIPRHGQPDLLVIQDQTYLIKWVYDETTDEHTDYESYLADHESLRDSPGQATGRPEEDHAFLEQCRLGLQAMNGKQYDAAASHLQKAIVIYQSFSGEPLLHTVHQAEHSDGNVRKTLFAELSAKDKTYTKAGNTLLENLFRSDEAIRNELEKLSFTVREEVQPEQGAEGGKKPKKVFRDVETSFSSQDITKILEILTRFRDGLSPQFLPDYLLEQLRAARQSLAGRPRTDSAPAILDDPEFVTLYTELAQEKFVKERSAAEVEQVIKALDPARQDKFIHAKSALLVYLRDTTVAKKLMSDVPLSIADILARYLPAKTGEIKSIFDDHPELAEDAAHSTRVAKPNPMLADLAAGKQAHSITDIDDYVGDKLSDPLMKWIVGKGIPVEVHATSALGSFGRLHSQGFTELTEVPSLHRGTKKYIAYNPKTKQIKVVVQSLPGESYTIQTSGAFLLYELYAYDKALAQRIQDESKGESKARTYAQPGYQVKRVLEFKDHEATYIALAPKQQPVAVIVGCHGAPCAIDDHGRIVLDEHYDDTIGIRTADARTVRMNPDKLTIVEENVDYQRIYRDTLEGHGIHQADIAVIGNTAALQSALGGKDIKPTLSIETPYMSGAAYHVQGKQGPRVVLSFPISPYFFGDKSGHLARALTALGVKDILFGGTAGGLAPDAAKGDVLVAEGFVDMTTGVPRKIEGIQNKAAAIAAKYQGTNVKLAGLHAGVHSAIVESMDMIALMRESGISGVDCEASFIARALAGTAVDLYHTVGVSDVPGTQESIGMGGSAHGPGKQAETKQIEQIDIFMDVLTELLGKSIGPAESKLADITVDALRDSSFSLRLSSTDVVFNFQFVYPQITKGDQTTERTRIINLFARELVQLLADSKLSPGDLKQTSDPQQRQKLVRLQSDIMNLSLKFQQLHKIKVWLTNMVLPEVVP